MILQAIVIGIGTYHLLKYLVKFWLWFGQHCIKLAYDISDKIIESDIK